MRKGNINLNRIYSSIPFTWGRVDAYYEKLSAQRHYDDGFRDVQEAQPSETQKVGDHYYDDVDDVFKFRLIDKSQAELEAEAQAEAMRPLLEEQARYRQRKEDGIEAFLKISAELRLAKLSGAINEEAQRAVELAIEPVRDEVVLGQWISAREKLEIIGFTIIGQEFYNRIFNDLNNYINENY